MYKEFNAKPYIKPARYAISSGLSAPYFFPIGVEEVAGSNPVSPTRLTANLENKISVIDGKASKAL
jgi:hypothetical protein